MAAPIIISLLATLSGAVMAYGTDARWASHGVGLGLIMMSRRLQWPLIVLSIIACLVLLGMVISGRRRAWWLIGLAPVMALFVHRFATGPICRYSIADSPQFVAVADAGWLHDDDQVIGVVFNDQAYAYPVGVLRESPVVVQSDRQHRLALVWSPRAGFATALLVAPEVKARDLEIVSDPADGMLLYSSRTGQFIAGMTGLTVYGQKPMGVTGRLPVVKCDWQQWKARHADARVMLPIDGSFNATPATLEASRVAVIGTAPPLVLPREEIENDPINCSAGDVPVLVFRDRGSGRIVAFDRHVAGDLVPKFHANTNVRRKGVALVDGDTHAGWSAAGVAIDGDKALKGKRLASLDVQDDVSGTAARFWFGSP